ncbi:serine protease [Fusarium agapanthi]|uniref:Serine protease n=1 Tax=Fusarium agapanthi TaxID=1803897 RepID=A0A9P5E578_9HYPO|nr:serine protease [Fusarium agapanthi]
MRLFSIDVTAAVLLQQAYEFSPRQVTHFETSQRPGGVLGNSTYIKHFLNPLSNHCTDTYRNAGTIWPEVKAIQEAGIDQIEKWVAEFPKSK